MIGVINYGLGNVDAFINSFDLMGIKSFNIENSNSIPTNLQGLIIPGVGAFDDAITRFNNLKNRSELLQMIGEGLPTLGVCVGMQMLFDISEEGKEQGLGFIKGKVIKFKKETGLRYPHMGPNLVHWDKPNRLSEGIFKAEFYFLHGYYCKPKFESDILGSSHYGINFPTVVKRGNVYGVQFHPEKSHYAGKVLLENFARICGLV